MPIHELAALGTALSWAISPLFAARPATWLGAAAFNRLRQVIATLMLALIVGLSGSWRDLPAEVMPLLVLSGLLGITLGDTLLFAAFVRIGPRRTGVIFALNAPMAALLGWLVLGETPAPAAVAGILLAFTGTALAIRFGGSGTHRLEAVTGSLATGLILGLLAALGQATGTLIARPIMATGIDPFAASLVRVACATAALSALMALPFPVFRPKNALTVGIAAQTAMVSFLGLGLGMSLMMFALSGGEAGIISTLTATSPVIILPLLWLHTGQRPSLGAWAGAALVVAGIALIFSR